MNIKLPLIMTAAIGTIATAGTVAALTTDRAPAGAQDDRYWAGVDWDHDDDDYRRGGALPLPDARALKRAGMVSVHEVERDDGSIEVEGRDARGRELNVRMDQTGKRVLSKRLEDRWDD